MNTSLLMPRRVLAPLMIAALATACAGASASRASACHAGQSSPDAALEREIRNVPIAMYMTAWCPVCTAARRWLEEGGYRFVELDVEEDERARFVLSQLNPRGSVPMFAIEGRVVIGFDPDMLHAVLERVVAERAAPKPPVGEGLSLR